MGFEDLILNTSCIASHEHYNSIVMHLDVCNWFCTGRFGLGWAHHTFYIACHMFMHSYLYFLSFQYILWYILNCFRTFLIVFYLFLPLSIYIRLLLWHPNVNLLRLETLFFSGNLLLLTLLLSLSDFVMRRPNRTSLRTFLNEAFILNAKSSCWTSPTPTYRLLSTVGDGGHCVTPRSLVHSWWSKSFTSTCIDSIIQYLISLLAFKVRV